MYLVCNVCSPKGSELNPDHMFAIAKYYPGAGWNRTNNLEDNEFNFWLEDHTHEGVNVQALRLEYEVDYDHSN